MKIHAKCSNNKKTTRQKHPYRVRKQRRLEKKRVKEIKQGFTAAEAALGKAQTEHQRKQLKTNPNANVRMTKKRLRKMEKVWRRQDKIVSTMDGIESILDSSTPVKKSVKTETPSVEVMDAS